MVETVVAELQANMSGISCFNARYRNMLFYTFTNFISAISCRLRYCFQPRIALYSILNFLKISESVSLAGTSICVTSVRSGFELTHHRTSFSPAACLCLSGVWVLESGIVLPGWFCRDIGEDDSELLVPELAPARSDFITSAAVSSWRLELGEDAPSAAPIQS